MAVADRWHRIPDEGEDAAPCRCAKGRARLYPSAEHLRGDRWQVRWRDPDTGRQKSQNFALRDGENANLHADAFDKQIQGQIITRTYTDPKAGEVTLQAYAEEWRALRSHDTVTAGLVERRLRCHVYPAGPGAARTPRGGLAIGQKPMGLLAARPTMIAAWVKSLPLAPGSAAKVVDDVSAVFEAAVADGVVRRNPVTVKSVVDRPRPGKSQARAWPRERLDAVRGHLPGRYEIIASLGAGTGMRQGEMGALGLADITWLGRDPRISVARQLKTVDGVLCFAPLKNRKKHEVPLAPSLGRALARHLQLHPAVRATLPWHDLQDPKMHGKPVTVDLVLSRPNGLPLAKPSFEGIWQTAAAKAARDAGEVPGARLRALAAGWGVHGTRHTFVSNCLRERIDPIRVAEWVGDTVAELLKTYAHMVPGRGDDDGRAVVDAYLEGPLEEPSARDVPSEAAD